MSEPPVLSLRDVRRTYVTGAPLGPYRTGQSACLSIARQLLKELTRRDAPSPTLPL